MQIIGTPSYRNQSVDRATLVVVPIIAVAILAFAFWVARSMFAGETVRRGFTTMAIYIPAAVMMWMGLRGPLKRIRHGRLERPLDAELAKLPEDYVVFCARPWCGETQEREKVRDNDDPRTWTLTDRYGRPAGSMSPYRTVIGPTGVWLILAAPTLSSKEALDHVAQARESMLALKRYLKTMALVPGQAEQPEQVVLFVAAVEDGLAAELQSGRKFALSSLAQLIAGAPLRGGGSEPLKSHALTLACCYTDNEREAGVRAIEALAAPLTTPEVA